MPTVPDVNFPPESTGIEVPPVTTPVQPGEKTDPALLLKSLQEEREKRRIAEADLLKLQTALASGDTSTEEGKVLKTQISTLESTIASMAADQVKRDLEAKFPVLKDKATEFAEFRKQYPAGNDENIAKIFLSENGLLDAPQARKGLEKPSGGGRNTTPQGWTYASVEELRKNNFRQYTKLLKEGAFKDIAE